MIESPINSTRWTPGAANSGRPRAAIVVAHVRPGFAGPAVRSLDRHTTSAATTTSTPSSTTAPPTTREPYLLEPDGAMAGRYPPCGPRNRYQPAIQPIAWIRRYVR